MPRPAEPATRRSLVTGTPRHHRAPRMSDARKTLPTDTPDGTLLVISGPSGVGKTTITRAVERTFPGSVFSVSATTRPRTEADVDGVDYRFVTDAQFDAMIAQDAVLEWANVFGK